MILRSLLILSLLLSCTVIADENSTSIEDFFRRPVVTQAVLNPSGNLVAYERFGAVMVGSQGLPYTDIFGVNNRFEINKLIWLSEDIIAIQIRKKSSGEISTQIIELLTTESEIKINRTQFISNDGYIVDPLKNNPGAFLFAQYRVDDEKVFSDVHRIPLFSKKPYRFKKNKKYNYNSGKIINWITGNDGSLRLGLSYENRKPSLWHRTSAKSHRMTNIWTGNTDTEFSVYGINADFTKAWVVTDFERDKSAAAIFNLETATIDSIIFEHPKYDIHRIIMDSNGENPLAVTYLDQGELVYHFMSESAEIAFNAIKDRNPDHQLSVFDSNSSAESMLLFQYSASDPGALLHCQETGNKCSKVTSLYPWLDDVSLSVTDVFLTQISDNVSVEAFLSYPSNLNKTEVASLPLIIMPHGGPIGVFDSKHLNSDVEWLVHNRYAVLRVNYRGSGGYGNAFKAQGLQQWGRAIEQDINAATENAFKKFTFLDKERVCLLGGSYGGYSAIMGIIQNPGAYRCAISFAGVTDLPLLFNKSSIQNDEEMLDIIKSIVGDPSTHMSELQAFSPVYNANQISRPLLLIHGSKDDVVDVEHSWRLSHMLNIYEIEHTLKTMNGVNHSFTSTKQVKDFYESVMPFLEEHLSK
ncbi:alpha/beta hydrolase family protein [Alteromonas facilis]|uniref:alpha/beta hydrolase family protein n=1 Tax=Alteromonas facilis TaxID=2048004 RepID=UPI000C287CC5|nr:prolyl oligopeptidase family serine peptidase [Alteromonas facilis]